MSLKTSSDHRVLAQAGDANGSRLRVGRGEGVSFTGSLSAPLWGCPHPAAFLNTALCPLEVEQSPTPSPSPFLSPGPSCASQPGHQSSQFRHAVSGHCPRSSSQSRANSTAAVPGVFPSSVCSVLRAGQEGVSDFTQEHKSRTDSRLLTFLVQGQGGSWFKLQVNG